VPNTTEAAVAATATMRVFCSASQISRWLNSRSYQPSDQPPQVLPKREALNELITSTRMGR
jgi:hypothetical protein